MKTGLKLIALIAAVACFASACASITGAKVADERVLSDVQRIYRSSSLVVMGECVQSHLNEDGVNCYDLIVGEVLAGKAEKGDLIHCTDGAMKQGESYLLYLAPKDEPPVYYSEDTVNYALLTDEPLRVMDEDEVVFSGVRLSLHDIRANIAEQNRIVAAPSETYYYKSLEALTDASAEIFIGRVADVPRLSETRFRSDSAGASVENTLPAATLKIEVYGSIKGALRYGETIELVHCPALCDEMIDAASLKSLSYTATDATTPTKDGVYLFFLVASPDGKQNYYFGVNPIQGLARVDSKDRVHVTYLNRALSGYYSLDALVKDIRTIIDG